MAGIWRKTLVYLGLVEDEEFDEYAYEEYEPEQDSGTQSQRKPVRRVAEAEAYASKRGSGSGGRGVVTPMPTTPSARFHLVHPTTFNDAQEIGDKFREGFSVLMNLQTTDAELSRRLVDFASGLAYGLGGSMQPVAERVFIVTPAGVQFTAEERRRLLEERGFFNQA
jgi:cell division inhibitor SepF